MAMSLEDLKAENAKAEEAAETETEEVEVEETETDEVEETETETEVEGDQDDDESEDAPDESEEWKQGDGHESPDGKKFTDSDIGKAKAKLRAKLEKRHQEDVDKLRQELEELRSVAQKPSAQAIAKPKREEFDADDDPDAAYYEALSDWKVKTVQAEAEAKAKAEQAKAKQTEHAKKVEAAVDQHYERAVKLAEKSGISAEAYQGADLKVRQTIDSLYPEAGDPITDALIANLGEGSEKVIYNLGVNSKRLAELKSRLTDDPTGISAATYLGMLNAELTAPAKRKTKAPAPAPALNGDSNSSSGIKALKRRYDEAHTKGDLQSAFEAKRKAKAAGADTKDW